MRVGFSEFRMFANLGRFLQEIARVVYYVAGDLELLNLVGWM